MAPHIPESYDIFNYAALLVSISNVIPVKCNSICLLNLWV